MKDLNIWKLHTQLSIHEAAMLMLDVSPLIKINELSEVQKEEFTMLATVMSRNIENGVIEGDLVGWNCGGPRFLRPEECGITNSTRVSFERSYLSVISLKDFLLKNGYSDNFFVTEKFDSLKCLNKLHPCYSAKLDAAIHAWEAISRDENMMRGTVKQSIEKWLGRHAAEYGLIKDDGALNKEGIEQISKVVNWAPQGGSPKIPSRSQK